MGDFFVVVMNVALKIQEREFSCFAEFDRLL